MKKLLFVLIPIILIVGIVGGLAFTGILEIPGITPKKKPKNIVATKNPKVGFIQDNVVLLQKSVAAFQKEMAAEEKRKKNAQPKKKAVPPPSTEPGEMKLASIWNGMDVTKLKDLVMKWPAKDVAKIALRMEEDQVTALLAAVDTPKANEICKAMQAEANQIKANADAAKEAQKN